MNGRRAAGPDWACRRGFGGRTVDDDAVLGAEDLESALQRVPSGAIEEYAEWIPDGLPESALKGLYKGETAIIRA